MTREQRIDKFRHDVQGVWLDLVIACRRGSELSMSIRCAQVETDRFCRELFDEINKTVPQNGTAPTPTGKK